MNDETRVDPRPTFTEEDRERVRMWLTIGDALALPTDAIEDGMQAILAEHRQPTTEAPR